MLKNPYYIGFQLIMNLMLIRQAKIRADSGIHETIEVLFDNDTNEKRRLETGFNHFIQTVKRNNPQFLELLLNRNANFQDDKLMKPLQAADLLAWHLRRFCAMPYETIKNPVWSSLREGIEYEDYRYTEKDWLRMLLNIRDEGLKVAARALMQ
jgi:hypothetical protein